MKPSFAYLLKNNSITVHCWNRKAWEEVEHDYLKLCSCYDLAVKSLDGLREDFHRAWGRGYHIATPHFPSLPTFSSVKEAKSVLAKELAYWGSDLVHLDIYHKAEQEVRCAWISSIVAQAPQNCSLIVIKDGTGMFSKQVLRNFNATAKAGTTAELRYLGKVYCVAFEANVYPDIDDWAMVSAGSTVEYL